MITLSALDQSPIAEGSTAVEALQQTARLAAELDKWGYHRFWVSEHHHAAHLAGTSPEVLISHLAAKTSRIRVGSGGVMLPHYSAYKVAENFRLLEALYPNRIDLGLGRAPGGMPLSTRALQEGKVHGGIDQYPDQLDDLIDYLHDSIGEDHPYSGLRAMPLIETAPELWLLGSSDESGGLAAQRGAAFAFAHFINGFGGTDVMRTYRRSFRPSVLGAVPRTMVAVFAFCAETEEEANRLASSLDLSILLREKGMGRRGGVPTVEEAMAYPYTEHDKLRARENRKRMIIGTKEQVKQRIVQMSEEYEADEFMIVTITHDFAAKLRSYRLLAEAFGLPGVAGADA
ncbi:LLM class flavin-dependent oxidoreductase [Brevibacillus fluminis]|uniref:LLM class flavin-dependent oxidoreductase n=1 Tax=Brevibacillus fluminis TaxID=511487 RepID=A0A3M8CVE0_9BACL|nr:LLM class flavin-dependent oxidoreductase [Brevibacillus fluminis]RNB79578.1 LLM class flavin-dependent oxidoreductase [Brevibacillus fluminis]